MANDKRSSQAQSRHDETVRRIAAACKGRGYKVQADVDGYKQPQVVRGGGARPTA